MTPHNRHQPLMLFNLYYLSFLGSFGYFLLLPVLAQLFSPGQWIGSHYSHWWYSVILGLMPLTAVLTAPTLGRLADHYGTRHLLLIGNMLMALSYALPILAIHYHQLIFFVLGSILNGLSANIQPLSQATLSKIRQNQLTTARRFGWDAMAMALATIIGPLFSHALSNQHWASWLTISTPFYVAIAMSLLAFVMTAWTCPRLTVHQHQALGWRALYAAFTDSLRLPMLLKILLGAYFIMQLAWAVFYQNINWQLTFLQQDMSRIATYLTLIGAYTLVAQCIIYPVLLRWLHTQRLLIVSTSCCAICTLLLIVPNIGLQWLIVMPLTLVFRLYYPSVLTYLSQLTAIHQRGWLIALCNALLGFAWFLSGFIAVAIQQGGNYVASTCVFGLFALAWLLQQVVQRQTHYTAPAIE